jgi:hypothetical protein
MNEKFKILAWNMFDKRYVGDVNRDGKWFEFAIVITKHPNKTYDVDTWVCDSITDSEEIVFEEPSYNELRLYGEALAKYNRQHLEKYRENLNENRKKTLTV